MKVKANQGKNAPTPLSEESLKQHTQHVGYVDTLDTLRKDDDPPRASYQSHAKQQVVKSSKKKVAMAAPLKGHREKVPENRYAPPSSSSDEEDNHCNNTGSQDLSPASNNSWTTKLKLPSSIAPRQDDHLSAPRPKALRGIFDEEASRDSKEADQAASKVTKKPAVKAKTARAKIPPSQIFRNKGKRKPKTALPATKPSIRPKVRHGK